MNYQAEPSVSVRGGFNPPDIPPDPSDDGAEVPALLMDLPSGGRRELSLFSDKTWDTVGGAERVRLFARAWHEELAARENGSGLVGQGRLDRLEHFGVACYARMPHPA
jgi:hypothetical protein